MASCAEYTGFPVSNVGISNERMARKAEPEVRLNNKKSRSHRSAADGGRSPRKPDAKRKRDSAQPQERRSHQQKLSLTRKCLKTHSETSLASDHPVRAFSERDHFFDGAPTPPLQGREHARLNSFTKGKTTQVSRPADRKDDPPHGDLDPVDRKDDPPHGDLDPADHDL